LIITHLDTPLHTFNKTFNSYSKICLCVRTLQYKAELESELCGQNQVDKHLMTIFSFGQSILTYFKVLKRVYRSQWHRVVALSR